MTRAIKQSSIQFKETIFINKANERKNKHGSFTNTNTDYFYRIYQFIGEVHAIRNIDQAKHKSFRAKANINKLFSLETPCKHQQKVILVKKIKRRTIFFLQFMKRTHA